MNYEDNHYFPDCTVRLREKIEQPLTLEGSVNSLIKVNKMIPEPRPRISQPWAGHGGIYVGVARGGSGLADYHLVMCTQITLGPGMALEQAISLAKHYTSVEGHQDYTLPNREEALLLVAHLQDWLTPGKLYWIHPVENWDGSWAQNVDNGLQQTVNPDSLHKAVFVRRIPI